ncbi:proteasome subunit alpha type-7-like isoform X2 [Drosophila kikkawai]|nr:proteasome subunit alpha type-7-like [Drosophila kikkawai]
MRPKCNQAVTLFSPEGRLPQVEYAVNSVKKGSTVVGIRCFNCVVMALEQKVPLPMQMERSLPRIFPVDENVMMTYAGMAPDGRVLLARARSECKKLRTLHGGSLSVKQVTEYIADLQLKHTQAPDCRPFGVSCLVGGFDPNLKPRLYQTDPYGNYYEYKAWAIGRSEETVQAYLETVFTTDFVPNRHRAIKLAIDALLLVCQPENKNFEVVLLKRNNHFVRLDAEIVAEYVNSMDESAEG